MIFLGSGLYVRSNAAAQPLRVSLVTDTQDDSPSGISGRWPSLETDSTEGILSITSGENTYVDTDTPFPRRLDASSSLVRPPPSLL